MWDQDTLYWKERRSRHQQGPPVSTRVSAERQPAEESIHFLPRRATCVQQPGPAAPVAAAALDDGARGAVTPATGGVLDTSNNRWVAARVDGLDNIIELREYLDFHVGRTIAHYFPGRADGKDDSYYRSIRVMQGDESGLQHGNRAVIPPRREAYGNANYVFDYYILFESTLAASLAVQQRIFQVEKEMNATTDAVPLRYQINATVTWCQDVLFLEMQKKKAARRHHADQSLTWQRGEETPKKQKSRAPEPEQEPTQAASPNGHADGDGPARSSSSSTSPESGHPLLSRRGGGRAAAASLSTPPPENHVEDWLQRTAAPPSRSPSRSDPPTSSTTTTTTTTTSSSSLGREEPKGWRILRPFRREDHWRQGAPAREVNKRQSYLVEDKTSVSRLLAAPSPYSETATMFAVSLFYFSELHQRGLAVVFLLLRLVFIAVWTLWNGVRRVLAAVFYVGGGGRRARAAATAEEGAAAAATAAPSHHAHYHQDASAMMVSSAEGGDYYAAQVRRRVPWCGLWSSPLTLLAGLFYYVCGSIAPTTAEVDLRLWSWVQMGSTDPQRSIQRLRKKLALALPPPFHSGASTSMPSRGLSNVYHYDSMRPVGGSGSGAAVVNGWSTNLANININNNNNNNNNKKSSNLAAGARLWGAANVPGALCDPPLISEVLMRWRPSHWFLQYTTWSLVVLLVALYYNIGSVVQLFV